MSAYCRHGIQCHCSVTPCLIRWLALRGLHDSLQRHRAAHAPLLAALQTTYGDPRVDAANARALARLQEARPMIVGAGRAGDLIPGLEGRMVLHAGPPVEWERMCAPQRNAVIGEWEIPTELAVVGSRQLSIAVDSSR